MSLLRRFPSSFHTPQNDFRALFRLMDDITTGYENNTPTSFRAFSPRFDVEEREDAYHLYGELPGIDQKHIEIEFSDAHTLVVKGGSETSSQRWETPQGKVEDVKESKQPTVQDESKENTSIVPADNSEKAVTKGDRETGSKWWVSERSQGEFYRSFSFPSRVDQDGVKANLSKGILNIVVPKLVQKKSSKKVNIEVTD